MAQVDYFDQAPVGYLTVDSQGVIQDLNRTFAQWLGLEKNELKGCLFEALLNPQNQAEFRRFFSDLEKRRKGRFIAALVAKQGGSLWIRFDFSVLAEAADTVLFPVVASDISMQVGLEGVLNERLKELNCLYELSDLLGDPDISLDEALTQAVRIIPAAFRLPERTRIVIEIDGKQYSADADSIVGPVLAREIRVSGRQQGMIRVWVALAAPALTGPVFLPEEEELIKAIAAQIGRKVERTRTMEEKAESDRLLSLAQVVARVGYYSMDLKTGQWVGSPVLESIFGIDERFERTVENWQRQVDPADRDWLMQRMQTVIREGLRWDVEYRWIRPADGRVRWISGKGEFDYDSEGNPIRLSGFVQDISERKQAEEELRIREALLSQTQAIAHVGSWQLDVKSGKLTWSDEVYRIFGLQPQQFEATYEAFLYSVHPEDREALNNAYLESLKNPHKFYEMEHRILRQDTGETRYVLERGEHQLDSDGNIVRSIGMVQDISEYKNMLTDLQQAKEAAEESNRMKSAFVANVSHEIRTPMNAILGFTEMMLRETDLPERHRHYLKIIAKSGEHLLDLLNDVLEMSRIESGRVNLLETDFSLKQLLCDLEAMFLPKATSKGLKFSIAGNRELPEALVADKQKLSQILINLIDNAIKFTEHGEVSVHLWSVSTDDTSGKVRVVAEVRDEGPGISLQDQSRLFQLFSQTAIGEARGGTGLGLAISRNFSRLMGGDITVDSQPGKGSVFRLEVPAGIGQSEFREIPGDAVIESLEPGQKPFRILVVDDEQMNREVMAGILSRVGFSYRLAEDGEQALHLFKEWLPDLVLLDIRMPGLDGYETTRQLRSLPEGEGVPVIGVSAGVFAQDRQRAIASGMDDFVSKPFKAQELLQRIGDYLKVRYVYQTKPDQASATEAQNETYFAGKTKELAKIPADLQRLLREAAAHADYFELMAAIERLQEYSPRMAGKLRIMVLRYNYEACLDLLNTGDEAQDDCGEDD